jgi:hypothetical protein
MMGTVHRSEKCDSSRARLPRGTIRKGIGIVLGIHLLAPTTSLSCPIPVYRYALEFWEASPYRVEVYYRQHLAAADEGLVNQLLRAGSGPVKANVETRAIDVEDDVDEMTLRLFEELSPSRLPWMVLRYPRGTGMNNPVWSGPLSRVNVDRMLDSPARASIAEMLVDDATAVWVLLESGDRAKDRAAAVVLERELRRLEQTLKLPDLELWMSDIERIPAEKLPAVRFGSIRVSRADPRESQLVEMLLKSEADLRKFEGEPIIFPVYGRGIALWAIVGRGINAWTLTEAAEFLAGPCSCQVKMLNPGVDLLISNDWESKVRRVADLSVATPAVGMGEFSSRGEEARRRLDAATRERLGAGGGGTEAVDPDRIVYLDLSGSGRRDAGPTESAESVAATVGSERDTGMAEVESENVRSADGKGVAVEPASGPGEARPVVESESGGFGVYRTLALGFFGVVLLIAVAGAVLYSRAGRRA